MRIHETIFTNDPSIEFCLAFADNKVILQSGMDKQKKSADFRFHGSKFGPVFILKVVHSLAFDTMYFNKSSFIFPMN